MCLSPHEMTNKQVQEVIDRLRGYLTDPKFDGPGRNVLTGRLAKFEALQKERKEEMISV